VHENKGARGSNGYKGEPERGCKDMGKPMGKICREPNFLRQKRGGEGVGTERERARYTF